VIVGAFGGGMEAALPYKAFKNLLPPKLWISE
jgi:hypothetical protein